MVFPQTPLGIKVQLNLQGLGWTDIVRDVTNGYRLLMEDGISITRGHTAEAQRTTGSTMDFALLDPNGVFNNANPRSPYFGILPRNMPIRCYVQRPVVALTTPLNGGGYFGTASTAGMNAAGDLDVTIDVELTRMREDPGRLLAAKSGGSTNLSWAIRIRPDGFVSYLYTTSGSGYAEILSTAQVPNTGRFALRVFHDVVNGANNSVTFQTASTFAGSFTTLGSVRFFAGNVTLFPSTAALEICSGNGGGSIFSTYSTLVGRCYYFKYLVNGAQVALVDFTGRAVGTTAYTDPNGNNWTLSSASSTPLTGEVTNADYRFHGEVSSLPQTWDNTGKVVKVSLEAAGVIRRLEANATPLRSPIYKNFINLSPTGYWPLEDSNGALQAGSAVAGSPNAYLSDITFASDSTLAGSNGCMVLGSTGPVFSGTAKNSISNSTTQCSLVVFFKFPSIPLSNVTLFSLSVAGGAAARVDWVVETTSYRVNVYDSAGTLLLTNAFLYGAGAQPTNWIGLNLRLQPVGANTGMTFDWYQVGSNPANYYNSGVTTYPGVPGRFSKVLIQGIAALGGVRIAHIFLTQLDFPFVIASFFSYSSGYAGELAGNRWVRVLTDAGVSGRVLGLATDTEPMGAQPVDTIMNILYECADVDGGEIIEPRNRLGLDYRTRESMLNQYGLGLSYGYGLPVKQLSGTLAPVPDDLGVANDITLSRRNGASAQVTLDSGPMSTLDPTLGGIGRVQSAPEINNATDDRLLALAQYMLGLGTWPEARYPTMQVQMHRISAFTFYDSSFTLAVSTDVGDIFSITDLPPFLPPEALVLIARGQNETLTQFTWDITFNATPGQPYSVNALSSIASEMKRADSSNTVLNAAITSTATSAAFKTTTGALCVTTAANPTEFPFDLMLAGERVTVTAITGTTSPQTATLTRSVNGIVKAQLINTVVALPTDTAMRLGL